jgi:precorrin-2 dehydrogenase/sirohydrochlorin ferrochelatase
VGAYLIAVELRQQPSAECPLLPILLTKTTRVGLAGQGDSLGRRASLLVEAGVSPVLLATDAEDDELAGLRLLFVAGVPAAAAGPLAARARSKGVLVNVEDVPELCDFHVPAIVRRGDLVLSVSTGGRVPGLARRLRESLEHQYGPEWSNRLNELSDARESWRAEGLAPQDVSKRTRERIAEKGWL